MILPIIAEGKKLLKGYKIRLSNIAANKIAEHVYRIQSIEDIKNENIFTDEGRLNKRESILHCIDGRTAVVASQNKGFPQSPIVRDMRGNVVDLIHENNVKIMHIEV